MLRHEFPSRFPAREYERAEQSSSWKILEADAKVQISLKSRYQYSQIVNDQ